MALNWTLEVIVSLISVIPVSIAFFLVFRQFLREKEKNRTLLYLMLGWLCLMLWNIGEVLSYLLLSEVLFIIHIYFFIGVAFFITLLVDSISKERVGSIKISIISAVSALVVYSSFDSDSVDDYTFSNGDESLAMAGFFRISTTVLSLLMGFLYAYFMVKIYRNAPPKLRYYATLNLLGGIFLGILPVLLIAVGLTLIIPGIHLVFISLGALLSAIAIVNEPKLAYVLPFKAINITIIQINSGIPVYTHSWSKSEVVIDEALFSSMITGISSIMNESLQKGNMREIHLDDGILILDRIGQIPIAFVLVATKSSPSLRSALNTFAEKFIDKYQLHFFSSDEGMLDYRDESDLVQKCFPFVPEYD